jgi:putative ABC transport system ATP-binding protein
MMDSRLRGHVGGGPMSDAATTSLLYEARGLAFAYRLGALGVPALRGVDLAVERGGFYCLAGPSGSGKTTLLNLLGLVEAPQEGTLRFDGRDVAALGEREKNRIRRFRLGFIFQTFNLFPVLRADENVEYFLARQGLPRAERRTRLEQALRDVGLWEQRRQRPGELSGGQRQRVAIARALAKRPVVIIGDEPTASLDQETGRAIIDVLLGLNSRYGVTVIVSSHDPMVQSLATRRVELRDGRIA